MGLVAVDASPQDTSKILYVISSSNIMINACVLKTSKGQLKRHVLKNILIYITSTCISIDNIQKL